MGADVPSNDLQLVQIIGELQLVRDIRFDHFKNSSKESGLRVKVSEHTGGQLEQIEVTMTLKEAKSYPIEDDAKKILAATGSFRVLETAY